MFNTQQNSTTHFEKSIENLNEVPIWCYADSYVTTAKSQAILRLRTLAKVTDSQLMRSLVRILKNPSLCSISFVSIADKSVKNLVRVRVSLHLHCF